MNYFYLSLFKNRCIYRSFLLICFVVFSTPIFSQVAGDYRTNATGTWNWSSVANWQTYNGAMWVAAADYPGQNPGAGTVTVLGTAATTVNLDVSPANAIGAFDITTSTNGISHVLNFNGNTLNVTGAVTMTNNIGGGVNDMQINIDAGTLNCASVAMGGAANNNNRKSRITLTTGLIDCSGNFSTTRNQNRHLIVITGAATIRIGGQFNLNSDASMTIGAGSLIEYYSVAAANVSPFAYHHLNIEDGVKTATGNFTVAGDLQVNSGTFNVNSRTYTITGTTDIAVGAAFEDDNNNGVGTFDGAVTVDGTWTSTASTTAGRVVFNNTFTNNGTYNAGSVTYNLGILNNGIFNSGASVIGAGQTVTANTLVTFTGAFTCAGNLIFEGVGGVTNSAGNSSTTAGDLTINDATFTKSGGGLTVDGKLTVNSSFDMNSTGNLTVNGATDINGTCVIGNNGGTNTLTGLVTIAGAASWNSTAVVTTGRMIFSAGVINNGTFDAGTATIGAGMAITANNPMTFANVITCAGNFTIEGAGGVTNTGGNSSTTAGGNLTINDALFVKSGGDLTIAGNLVVNSGLQLTTTGDLTVTGQTQVNGSFQDDENTGVNIYTGAVIVGVAGTWDTDGITNNTNRMRFFGGITNNNTTAGSFLCGVARFDAAQTIGGAGPMSFVGAVLINGAITVTNQNTSTVTIDGGTLNGNDVGSVWLNDNGSTLSYSSNTQPMATGTLNAATATNTVIYTGVGPITTVNTTTYSNLIIDVGATASIAAPTVINSSLTLTNGSFDVAGGLTMAAATTITRENGSLTAAPTFPGSVNVVYLASVSTGPEIPNFLLLPGLNNLTLNTNGGDVTLGDQIVVNGTLTWSSNGVLVLGAFDLTMAEGSSFTGNNASRFIRTNSTGKLIKEGSAAGDFEIVYPVGTTTNYTPMQVTNVTSAGFGSPGNVSVRAVASRLSYVPVANNAITKYWDVSSSFVVTSVDVNFTFVNPDEVVGVITLYEPRIGDGVSVDVVSGPSAAGSTPTFSSTGHNTLTGHWTYVDLTVQVPKTYYSYQSGNWSTANVWTEDPSGTTLINPAVPGSLANDNVVILNGRTVTTAIARSVNSVEIRSGGVLNIGSTTGHNFGSMSGEGTLKVQSITLPGGLDNSSPFVSAAGGTIEYYDIDGVNLPADQTTYNNLIISNSTGSNNSVVLQNPLLATNYTLNGSLTTMATGAGSLTLQFAHTATNIINMTIGGGLTNGANCNMVVGSFNAIHNITVSGDFINDGSIDWSNSAQWVASTNGAINLAFTGASDKVMTCNGQTDIYSLTVNMGVDETYVLDVTASAAPNFQIFANTQNIILTKGTLKLGNGLSLVRLGVNNSQFNVNLGCKLVFDGATINTSGYDDGIRANQGTIIFNSGNCEFGNNGLNFNSLGRIEIHGGVVTVETLMPGGNGTADATFVMTGGELNITDALAGNPGGNNDLPQLALTDPNTAITISGGTINVYSSKNSARLKGAAVGIGSANHTVTGGTWNFHIPASAVEFGVSSTIPFYNLGIYKQGAGTSTVKFKYIGGDFPVAAQPIVVLNDLYIDGTNSPILDVNGQNLTVGGNFTIAAGGEYRPNGNITTFNGTSNQDFEINTQITSKTNLTVNKSGGTLTLAGTSGFDCLSALTLSQGTLADGGKNINVCGNVVNSGTHTGAGSVRIQRGVTSTNVTAGGVYALPSITKAGAAPTTHATFALTVKQGIVTDISVVGGGTGNGGNGTFVATVAGGSGAGLEVGYKVVGGIITAAWINNGGSGYGPSATDAGGGGGAGVIYEAIVTGNVDNTGGNGALTSVNVLSPGTGYTGNPNITITTGAGTADAVTTDVPVISGSGSGVFANLDQNNDLGSTFSANQTVDGNLRLAAGVMNISSFHLSLSGTSNVYDGLAGTGTAFSSAKMIQTAGLASNSGLTKMYSPSMLSFTYPVGSGGKYTPGTITLNAAPAVYGTINMRPVDNEHPLVSASGQSITYYWKVTSAGLTLGAATVTHTYVYDDADVVDNAVDILEAEYVPGRYNSSTITWTTNSDMAKVDEATNTITFDGVDFENEINGDYTAGDQTPDDPFSVVLTFYSRDGSAYDWDDPNSWSIDGALKHIGAASLVTPTANSVVKIGDGVTYNHTVVIDANSQFCGAMTIESGSVLDLVATTGHDFGSYVSGATGDGTMRISSSVAMAEFPSGDLSDFIDATGGTVEYYTTGGQDFSIPAISAAPSSANINTYNNLVITPAAGNYIEMPDNNLTVYTDYTVQGADATAQARLNSVASRTLTVGGNMDVNSGNLRFMNVTAQSIVVTGTVTVTNGAVVDIANTATAIQNTMSIAGSLTNEGTFNMVDGTDVCNITFTSIPDASITGANAGAVTTLNKLTVNKGASQTPVLNVDVAGTLTTPNTAWLTLTNGTFRFSKASTLTIENAAGYTIGSTVCLSVNDPGATVNVCYGNNSTYDLQLNGKLEVIDGTLNVGTTSGNHQDIQYASTGTPEINVFGGTLYVNGQIRRTTTVDDGNLTYVHTGGNVTIMGRNSSANRGRLEVLNNGSFTMGPGATLTLIRRGTTLATEADLRLTPASSSVTGGTIVFGSTNINTNRDFTVYSTVPFYNITVAGVDASDLVNVDLKIAGITIRGTLDIPNDFSAFRANNLPVTFSEGGVLVNSNSNSSTGVAVGGYQVGATAQITTFNSTTANQTITGAIGNLTNFGALVLNNTFGTVTLGANSNVRINGNLTMTSGTFADGGNTATVIGNIANSATHSGAGKILLQGSALQTLSGNGSGIFQNLELDNAAGALFSVAQTVNGTFTFTDGILDIDQYRLTLGSSAAIAGVTGTTKMILTNGVTADQGVLKHFNAGAANFTFPVSGQSGIYTPVNYNITANGSAGTVTVKPVNVKHPSTQDAANKELRYYWNISSTGFSGLDVTHTYTYDNSDVQGTEADYVTGRFFAADWVPVHGYPGTVDAALNTMTLPGVNFFDGDYTAGESDGVVSFEFDALLIYYSRNATLGGDWDDPNSWSTDAILQHAGAAAVVMPNGNPIFIASGHTINANGDLRIAATLDLDGTAYLDLADYIGHNFGTVTGTGIIKINATAGGSFIFPAGDYTAFTIAGAGTFEFGGATSGTLLPSLSIFNNLIFSGASTKTLPAATYTVNGDLTIDAGTLNNATHNSNISIAGDWTNNNTVGSWLPGTSTTTFNGSNAQSIGGTANTNFYRMVVNNTSATGVTLNRAVTITNALTLTDGNLYTSAASLLTLNDNVTSTSGSANSFVEGPMKKVGNDAFVFPVGRGTSWRRIAITAPATITTQFTAEYFNSPYVDVATFTAPITDVSVYEYWQLDRAVTADAVRVTLYWENAADSRINNCADLTVARWNGASWVEELGTASGSCAGTGTGSVQTNATVASFSPFTFGSKSTMVNPLPVELLSFSAELKDDKKVYLNWITASEINNHHFTVEKTTDGINFKPVVDVAGAGTSTTPLSYMAIDNSPYSGISYYRLKQVDNNGAFDYSQLIAVNNQTALDFSIFPNPATGDVINVNFTNNPVSDITIIMYDAFGKEIYGSYVHKADASSLISIVPEKKLSSGVYVISVLSGSSIYKQKVVVR